ncbi:DUF6262 family protein [Nocardia sp. NPDC052278]|uniref:DUF6262 family protein n=1 Tax=unclassified Nocardia TaxID=2637762 RepID=UPI0036856076
MRPDPPAGSPACRSRPRGPGRRLPRERTRPGPTHPLTRSQKDTTLTTREDRTAALIAAAKAKSSKKIDDAEQAIRRLLKRGEPVTFQAVQREASVSHAFLYNHADLRTRIERLRANARPARTDAPPTDSENTLIQTLSLQITELKKRHRAEVQALRDALEQAHGENLELRRELARRGTPTATSSTKMIGPC